MKIYAGRTILLHDVPKSHLYFVVTEPTGNPAEVVIVPINTRKRFSDTTLVLGPADHPFIVHDTVVSFTGAMRVLVSKLETRVEDGTADFHDDMDEDLLQRVRDGLLRSAHTVQALKGYCRPLF